MDSSGSSNGDSDKGRSEVVTAIAIKVAVTTEDGDDDYGC